MSQSDKTRLVIINPNKITNLSIRGVAFDFDDTLVKPPIEWQQVMAEYFVEQVYPKQNSSEYNKSLKKIKKFISNNAGTSLTTYMTILRKLVKSKNKTARSIKYYRKGFDCLWRKVTIDLNTPKDVIAGIPQLLEELTKHQIEIFVVTGGDRKHKVELIKKTGLSKYISTENIFGDLDKRFMTGFSKKKALTYINRLINKNKRIPLIQTMAMIGDGAKDMENAQKNANTLAIGYNQPKNADVCIYGREYPVKKIIKLLTTSNN